jgi:hypothetical protein
MAADGFDATDSVALLDLTNRQDFEACERCQLGIRSSAYAAVLAPPNTSSPPSTTTTWPPSPSRRYGQA